MLRHEIQPGDLGELVRLHGLLYAKEYGFDESFEAYVAGPLSEFVLRSDPHERLWIAENGGSIAGSVAILAASRTTAQLRWFLVAPSMRGHGLGTKLLHSAVEFSMNAGFQNIILWTVDLLRDAARLYIRSGFQRVEAIPARRWGVDLIEERYELRLGESKTH